MGATLLARLVNTQMSRVVLYQLLIILGFTLLMLLLKGLPASLSVFSGALSYWLPTLAFICAVSTQVSPRAGMRFLAVFLLGEGLKLLLCGTIFVVLVKYFHVQIIDAVIGLIVAIAAFWLASAAVFLKTGAKS